MPAKPEWLLRLPKIIEQLSAMDAPVVDRAVIERLFGVRRRRAIQLMSGFGGYQAGRTFLIDRAQLIARLGTLQQAPEFEYEHRRKERLADSLERVRKHRVAARVVIAVAPEPPTAILPQGVRLEPGRIIVEFDTVEELLRKLYELGQSASNDFERFRETVERFTRADTETKTQ